MEDGYCTDCKKCTDVILDHSEGDMICSQCGLVLQSHYVDEKAEWRTFADDFRGNDPDRVGESTNPLLPNNSLSTHITKPKGGTGDSLTSSLTRLQKKKVSNPDRHLMLSFETMASMSDRLGLVATIRHRANEIYTQLEEQRYNKVKNQEANMAACLLIASKQENKPRTINEICSVVSGATKKEIARAKEKIVKKLELEMGQSVHAGDFMKRFGSNLGMNHQAIKAAEEAIQKSEDFDIRRSPTSIVAAIIYIVTQVSNDKKTVKEISFATGVSETAIRCCYKDLRPYVSKIIPGWYVQEEDLKNLGSH